MGTNNKERSTQVKKALMKERKNETLERILVIIISLVLFIVGLLLYIEELTIKGTGLLSKHPKVIGIILMSVGLVSFVVSLYIHLKKRKNKE